MSYDQSSAWGRSTGFAPTRLAKAFTLPELLVVIGIIALLVTILVPTMGQAIHVARDRVCRDHLYRIGQVAHSGAMNVTGTVTPFGLPGSDAWVGPVCGVDKALLLCPEDPNKGATVTSGDEELDKYYILQQEPGGGTFAISNLGAAFGVGGGLLEDGQFWTNKAPTVHTGLHPCYCKNPVRKSNQVIAGVCGEAICVITTGTGGQMKFESVIGCNAGPGRGSASEHYLLKGTCTDPGKCLTTDTKIMRLGGAAYTTVDPSYSFATASTSYGMNYKIDWPTTNTAIKTPMMSSPSQMMTMDANSPQLRVGEVGWMSHVFDRHFGRAEKGTIVGKVNYVTTGGSVSSASKSQLTDEYNRLETKGDAGGSLFGSNATPVAKN